MEIYKEEERSLGRCHLVAMPFPGRGHINPMMNLCKLLASRQPTNLLITFVLTQEWLGYIGSDTKPPNISFATIPNVIPSEGLKANDFPAFYEAVMNNMEAPFEQLLDRLHPPVTAIIGDVELRWPIGVGNRRNLPVASFWTMSASFFSMLHHLDLFLRCRNLPSKVIDTGEEQIEQIPGISSLHLADLRAVIHENDQRVLQLALECISKVPKSQYLLFTTVYELEHEIIESLKSVFSFPVYPIGPAIPFLELGDSSFTTAASDYTIHDHLRWLDSQPTNSVLYISLGSFLSVSAAQMDEIAEAINGSSIRYFWVARAEASRLKQRCSDRGMVVAWCDQLKVLTHPSVGGFWSHCGWNSTLETVFSGVPILTFPLFLDQIPNGRQITEEWKNGLEVKKTGIGSEVLVSKETITELVHKFMDPESIVGKELRERARIIKDICHQAIAKGGSSDANLDDFIRSISCGQKPHSQIV